MKKIIFLVLVILLAGCGCIDEESRKKKYFDNLMGYIKSEKMKTRNLVFFGDEVRYSPDGKYVAFQIVIENKKVIYLYDRKEKKVVRGFWGDYSSGGDLFNFDRTSSKLIFMTEYEIDEEDADFFLQIMDLDGKNRKIILRPYQATMYPVFSRDNKTIFFAEYTHPYSNEVDMGGDKLHYVRVDEGVDRILLDKFFIVNKMLIRIKQIVPLVDGSNIVLNVDKIYLYNIYTSNLIDTGVEAMDLVYSDNYKDEVLYVDYERNNKGNLEEFVYKLNLKTMRTNKVFLIPEGADYYTKSFNLSPDGKKIMYVQQIPVTSVANMTNMIWEINIDGTGLRPFPVDLSKVNEFPVVNIEEGFDGVRKKKKREFKLPFMK